MAKNEIVPLEISWETLRSMLYTFRGKQVLLDADLADIYGYSTRAFNQQIKNNIERFDEEDLMFQLTNQEFEILMSKKLTSRWGGTRKCPYAFTEQGVYMLMAVLKGPLAVRQSKALVRLFKQMKDYIVENQPLLGQREFLQLSLQTSENTRDIMEARISLSELDDKVAGIVDKLGEVVTRSELSAVPASVEVTVFSDNAGRYRLSLSELEDFRREFPSVALTLKTAGGVMHDRYIVLDYGAATEKIYHCGASSKDGGNKVTTIALVNDNVVYHPLIDSLLGNPEMVLK